MKHCRPYMQRGWRDDFYKVVQETSMLRQHIKRVERKHGPKVDVRGCLRLSHYALEML